MLKQAYGLSDYRLLPKVVSSAILLQLLDVIEIRLRRWRWVDMHGFIRRYDRIAILLLGYGCGYRWSHHTQWLYPSRNWTNSRRLRLVWIQGASSTILRSLGMRRILIHFATPFASIFLAGRLFRILWGSSSCFITLFKSFPSIIMPNNENAAVLGWLVCVNLFRMVKIAVLLLNADFLLLFTFGR